MDVIKKQNNSLLLIAGTYLLNLRAPYFTLTLFDKKQKKTLFRNGCGIKPLINYVRKL